MCAWNAIAPPSGDHDGCPHGLGVRNISTVPEPSSATWNCAVPLERDSICARAPRGGAPALSARYCARLSGVRVDDLDPACSCERNSPPVVRPRRVAPIDPRILFRVLVLQPEPSVPDQRQPPVRRERRLRRRFVQPLRTPAVQPCQVDPPAPVHRDALPVRRPRRIVRRCSAGQPPRITARGRRGIEIPALRPVREERDPAPIRRPRRRHPVAGRNQLHRALQANLPALGRLGPDADRQALHRHRLRLHTAGDPAPLAPQNRPLAPPRRPCRARRRPRASRPARGPGGDRPRDRHPPLRALLPVRRTGAGHSSGHDHGRARRIQRGAPPISMWT